jgi:hypothetical protein
MMMMEIDKKILMQFVIASIGLIVEKIKAITIRYIQNEYLFKFYIIEKNEETTECISDIIFEFEALQERFIKLDKIIITLEVNRKYKLMKNEILVYATKDVEKYFK